VVAVAILQCERGRGDIHYTPERIAEDVMRSKGLCLGVEEALQGASDIIAQLSSEDTQGREAGRKAAWRGTLVSQVAKKSKQPKKKASSVTTASANDPCTYENYHDREFHVRSLRGYQVKMGD